MLGEKYLSHGRCLAQPYEHTNPETGKKSYRVSVMLKTATRQSHSFDVPERHLGNLPGAVRNRIAQRGIDERLTKADVLSLRELAAEVKHLLDNYVRLGKDLVTWEIEFRQCLPRFGIPRRRELPSPRSKDSPFRPHRPKHKH